MGPYILKTVVTNPKSMGRSFPLVGPAPRDFNRADIVMGRGGNVNILWRLNTLNPVYTWTWRAEGGVSRAAFFQMAKSLPVRSKDDK